MLVFNLKFEVFIEFTIFFCLYSPSNQNMLLICSLIIQVFYYQIKNLRFELQILFILKINWCLD